MNNEEQKMPAENKKKDFLLPASIVIAAVLVAGSVVWSTLQKNQAPQQVDELKLAENIAPVSDSDHILGDKNAPVKIVVFTDLECPYCKEYHKTLKRGLATFDGKIAVVYRNFPLSQRHNYAQKEAEASECVAELGGNQAYWDFVDKVFETTKSNDGLDPALLPGLAVATGVDKAKFQECLSSDKMASRVSKQQEDGLNVGTRGTPNSIVIGKNGKKYLIGGAYPFENPENEEVSFKAIIEKALADF